MANIGVLTSTDAQKTTALTSLSQNFLQAQGQNFGEKLYCVCRHVLLDRKPQRRNIRYTELINNTGVGSLSQQWPSYQPNHGHNNTKKELNTTRCMQGNETWENKHKNHKMHNFNKRSNLCEGVVVHIKVARANQWYDQPRDVKINFEAVVEFMHLAQI